MSAQLCDLVLIMLEGEDRSVDSGVGANKYPVFAGNTKRGVHSYFYILYEIKFIINYLTKK